MTEQVPFTKENVLKCIDTTFNSWQRREETSKSEIRLLRWVYEDLLKLFGGLGDHVPKTCPTCGYTRTVWRVCPSGCDTSVLI